MRVRFLVAVFGLVLAAVPLAAHHSFSSEYDANKPVTLEGVVTKIEWLNPHVYFYLNVKDVTGKVTNWALEMGAPSGLQRQGWTRNTLHVGDTVKVEGSRARNGTPLATMRYVSADSHPTIGKLHLRSERIKWRDIEAAVGREELRSLAIYLTVICRAIDRGVSAKWRTKCLMFRRSISPPARRAL